MRSATRSHIRLLPKGLWHTPFQQVKDATRRDRRVFHLVQPPGHAGIQQFDHSRMTPGNQLAHRMLRHLMPKRVCGDRLQIETFAKLADPGKALLPPRRNSSRGQRHPLAKSALCR